MARKKYRPGMNCEKTGKYACYDANGNEMYRDIDVEKDRRFPPSQEGGCYYEEQNPSHPYRIYGRIFLCLNRMISFF